MGQEALLRWVTSTSSSTGKIVTDPPFQNGLAADRWGAVPQIPRMAGSLSVADFPVTLSSAATINSRTSPVISA